MMKWGLPYSGQSLGIFGLLLLFCSGCVGDRPKSCLRQTDCSDTSQFCSGAGFCSHECVLDSDCPCASYCELKCGICIREDNQDPATCYPITQGLTVEDIRGVCANDRQTPTDPKRNQNCTLERVTVESCLNQSTQLTGNDASVPSICTVNDAIDGGAP